MEAVLQAAGSEGSEDMSRLQDIFAQASRIRNKGYLPFKGAFTDGGVDEDRYDYW